MLDYLYDFFYFLMLLLSVLLVFTLLSYILPSLRTLLIEIKTKSVEMINRFYNYSNQNFQEKSNKLIENYRIELQGKNTDANRFNLLHGYLLKKLNNNLEKYDRDLGSSINKLSEKFQSVKKGLDEFAPGFDANFRDNIDALELSTLNDISQEKKKYGMTALIYLLIVIAIVSINTFLMNEFWYSLGAGFRNLIPLFKITYSMLFAFIFAILEFGTGVAHYKIEMDEREKDAEYPSSFNYLAKIVIYIIVLVLALVEFVAFAKISNNLKLGDQFGFISTDFMYPVFNWFLSPFGPALTLFLMILGYKLTEAFFLWRKFRIQNSFKKDIAKIRKKFHQRVDFAEKIFKSIKEFSPKTEDISSKLNSLTLSEPGTSFIQNTNQKIDNLIKKLEDLYKSHAEAVEERKEMSKYSVLKQFFLSTFLLFLWLLIVHLTAVSITNAFSNINLLINNLQFYEFLGAVSVLSLIISIFIGLAGYFIKLLVTLLKSHSDTEQNNEPILVYIYITLIIIALIGAFILVATSSAVGQNYPLISWLLTLVNFTMLYYVGINIDNYAAVSYLIFTLIILAFISGSALFASFILLLIFCLAIIIYYFFESIIKIGEAIRNVFKRKGTTN